MDMEEKLEALKKKKAQISQGGGKERQDAQHARGKWTARERIRFLVDGGSFSELNGFIQQPGNSSEDANGEGVVTGTAKIDGRLVCVFAHDFTVHGGALGEMHARKIVRLMDLAADAGIPVIGLNDSGGARIHEGVRALDGYGQLFQRNAEYSGVIPQISVIMGPCAGGAVYSPALTDFVIMVESSSYLFITGPKVLKSVTGHEYSHEDLGGAKLHAQKSGDVHFIAKSEKEALRKVRKLLSYLPSNAQQYPPHVCSTEQRKEMKSDPLQSLVPSDQRRIYDVRELLTAILDPGSFLEIQPLFAMNLVIGFGRLAHQTVGVVANNPKVKAGALDVDASDKAARFIRFCDSFHIPILTFEDTSGFVPGSEQQENGIIRHGAKILYAFSEASVPKITVILRKAYGGAYVAMNSKAIGADFVFAWPTAEIAVMGAEGAAQVLFTKEVEASDDPEKCRKEKIEAYRDTYTNPYRAAEYGLVDDIIDPEDTNNRLIRALEILKAKGKRGRKHGNMPF
ncbi:propionyl-CoA carboxylase beta chain [Geomicrobium halophilum]|uniref:Propionyl-CoA carboxylase beta chain n=1 Tax=Geomicrobium halophilum TaxID=549000 RepID=A0A841PL70_9BACL|nr:acyl-CoA carboxylase subunit beta [Geomicrobium halophilum]MBB6448434.1 propionyl-CoA carboxylase beta chain [Geomicrobium halophilum]